MTDKEKLDKFVAEIERLKKIVDDPILSDNDLIIGERNTYMRLLSFYDSMQKESQVKESAKIQHVNETCKENGDSLTQESASCLDNGDMPIERWKQAVKAASNQRNYRSSKGLTETRDDYFVDGVQWADEHPKEEPASEEMWEASKQYALRQVLASTDAEMSEQDYLGLKLFSGFELAVAHKDGAQWQKKKDDHAIEIAHMAGEEEGKNLLKQQMLQNAITATCFGFQGAALFSFRLPSDNYLVGSERKIVLIKDE